MGKDVERSVTVDVKGNATDPGGVAAAAIIADALRETLLSSTESDTNDDPATIVDGLFAIARGIEALARAVREHP
mgnify:CR=1 FL=1|jgi:hypothetical protein